ncbi:MAG TPA: ATP-binding protein [Segetibacter sp.]
MHDTIVRVAMEEDETAISEQDFFTFLLEFNDYAIVVINARKIVSVWNKGAENLYGYSSNEMLGNSLEKVYQEKVALQQHESYLEKARLTSRAEYDSWRLKKDNTPFYANTIITPLFKADGSVKGFVKILRDKTETKKLEEENTVLKEGLEEKVRQRTKELEVVNKELEAFSYSVSHDLRTPLRAVSGYSMMLKEDYDTKLDGEGNRIIDNIIHNTKMMGQLIDDLLTFSKMARLETANQSIDMKKLVESCIENLMQNEKNPSVKFLVGDLLTCNGDNSMLRQVWYNLISNAVKYSSKKEKPVIEIASLDDKGIPVYYVKDNGEGFDMKYVNKLFGVFQRLHRQDEFEGTGLGLALAKRIVSKHGGDIWAEAALGLGATFYFSIPKS